MSLVDPKTGKPFATRNLTDQEIISAFQGLAAKTEYLNRQSLHLGLYVEFLAEKLINAKDKDGNPLILIDMTEFPAFADSRLADLQKELTEKAEQQAKETKINLDE